jgi:ParB family transcriptional regulator, chromosome partitioning protein
VTKERRLGRGLEALLGRTLGGGSEGDGAAWHDGADGGVADATGGLTSISVYEIDSNPFQPRRDVDQAEIDSLADSLNEHGLIQPIVVRRQGERYQLIAGERRLRAAIKAGWPEVPVQVREADDRQVAELAIVENLQRRDLNALEKAASFRDYLQRYECTQEELASRLKIDRSTVANLIRLLELPGAVQEAVRSSAISAGHARALLPLGEEHEQVAVCERIRQEGLSVRAVEELVQETIRHADSQPLAVVASEGPASKPAARRKARNGHLAALEQELRAALGTKVSISQAGKGRGRIVIHFGSHDEFERLRGQLAAGQALAQTG